MLLGIIIVTLETYTVLNSLEINFVAVISFNPHTVPSSITISTFFQHEGTSSMALDGKCLGF